MIQQFLNYKAAFTVNPKDRILGMEEYSIPCMLPIPFTPSGLRPLGIVVKM
jgi:hypothetical protein